MKSGKQLPPKPGMKLYENLFMDIKYEYTIKIISDGLFAINSNANRLIGDVELLIKSDRYSSAAFLLATTDEEMAKAYILLDMCRLDFTRHKNFLKNLCRAFYNHVLKSAYIEIVRFPVEFRDMTHVKELWDVEIKRWWPSGYESGEPDMPHDTYFARELPLYVDFIDFDQQWHVPQHDTRKYTFDVDLGVDSLSKSRKMLKQLCNTSESGLYSPECLSSFNEVFKDHFLSDKTDTEQIKRIYRKAAERLGFERFKGSALSEWPLYSFVG
jgi:AbiV family abortive infection protein